VPTRILVVDDEALIRKSLEAALTDRGYSVETAPDAESAIEVFERRSPDIVILDINLPDRNGVDLLEELRERDPAVRVIMITAHGGVRNAVAAMKLGAVDFLRKPYELDEIFLAVGQAAEHLDRDRRLNLYEERDRASFSQKLIVGESSRMRALWETVEKVARSTTTTVLLIGESGTGKELFAEALHHLSDRGSAPMVEVNCSSFQEHLLENELFGHEKGAFTGATQLKRGLVELANGGTLFLDEVGEMPLVTQAKLLRFIDNQTFRRVGGCEDKSVDLRLIAATNANLEDAVAKGTFRKDLYYRLKVLMLELPPLREREADIAHLARHFLAHFTHKLRKSFTDFSPEVIDLLRRHDWPGNVRELKNLLERVVLLEDGEIVEIEHLPADFIEAYTDLLPGLRLPPPADPGAMTLREAADRHILQVLDRCDGNRSQAARVLDVSRQHLIARLKHIEAQLAAR
jgi:DNA-binding NtrC family response regulator